MCMSSSGGSTRDIVQIVNTFHIERDTATVFYNCDISTSFPVKLMKFHYLTVVNTIAIHRISMP